MASVPSRRGSGLDVASSRGSFVAGAFHVGYATREWFMNQNRSESARIDRSRDRVFRRCRSMIRKLRSAEISPVFKRDRLTLIGREWISHDFLRLSFQCYFWNLRFSRARSSRECVPNARARWVYRRRVGGGKDKCGKSKFSIGARCSSNKHRRSGGCVGHYPVNWRSVTAETIRRTWINVDIVINLVRNFVRTRVTARYWLLLDEVSVSERKGEI